MPFGLEIRHVFKVHNEELIAVGYCYVHINPYCPYYVEVIQKKTWVAESLAYPRAQALALPPS